MRICLKNMGMLFLLQVKKGAISLTIRTRKAGDRIKLKGMNGSKR